MHLHHERGVIGVDVPPRPTQLHELPPGGPLEVPVGNADESAPVRLLLDRVERFAPRLRVSDADLVVTFRNVHSLMRSGSEQEAFAAMFKALKPGGLILIHDFLLNDTLDGPVFPALFSMNMLLNNQGRSYSEKEISEMLSQAGAMDIHRLGFQGANDSGILCGTV